MNALVCNELCYGFVEDVRYFIYTAGYADGKPTNVDWLARQFSRARRLRSPVGGDDLWIALNTLQAIGVLEYSVDEQDDSHIWIALVSPNEITRSDFR